MINCKSELKLKFAKHCVLSACGNDNEDVTSNNIIFNIKDTKLHLPAVTLSAKDNQKLSKLLGKTFKRSVYWNECKIKGKNKITTNNYRLVPESKSLGVYRSFVNIYSNEDDDLKKYKAKKVLYTNRYYQEF